MWRKWPIAKTVHYNIHIITYSLPTLLGTPHRPALVIQFYNQYLFCDQHNVENNADTG